MPLALVTGPRSHLGPTAATLARTGFNVFTWEMLASGALAAPQANRRSFSGILRKSNAGTGPDGPFDCYVQLPCSGAAGPAAEPIGGRGRSNGKASVRWVGPYGRPAADELVCRIDTLGAVAARLAPTASVLLGADDPDPAGSQQPGGLAPDLLAAVALALLEDMGRPAVRVAVISVEALCRPVPAFARIDPVFGATQWEMPTPPLVSAP